LQSAFSEWTLVLTVASQSLAGLWLALLLLLPLLLPQLCHPNHRFGHGQAPLPVGVSSADLVQRLDLR
jgi:hypothetical protein